MWDYLKKTFKRRKAIEKEVTDSPDPRVKNSGSTWKTIFKFMEFALTLGAVIAGPILVWKLLKGLADEETGCYQYLPNGASIILDGDCGGFYKDNPGSCRCLSDSPGDPSDLTFFTTDNKDGILPVDALAHCNDNNEIIKNNPTCRIHGQGGSCFAKSGTGPLKPLGCTKDYTVSYGYFKKTPFGVFNDIVKGLANALPSFNKIIKILIYCFVIIISLIILVFLIRYFISLFSKKRKH